jgi:hypothetical protein
MGNRPSCRGCRHCTPPVGVELGWCQLRQLPIHPDLVSELWCHHWTARPPKLPVMHPIPGAQASPANEQLSFAGLERIDG